MHLLVEAILLFKETAVWENFVKVVCVKASIFFYPYTSRYAAFVTLETELVLTL